MCGKSKKKKIDAVLICNLAYVRLFQMMWLCFHASFNNKCGSRGISLSHGRIRVFIRQILFYSKRKAKLLHFLKISRKNILHEMENFIKRQETNRRRLWLTTSRRLHVKGVLMKCQFLSHQPHKLSSLGPIKTNCNRLKRCQWMICSRHRRSATRIRLRVCMNSDQLTFNASDWTEKLVKVRDNWQLTMAVWFVTDDHWYR